MSNSFPAALLLAYYFPPATGIASERAWGFFQHLPDFGWEPWVVAPRDPHFHQAGEAGGEDPERVLRSGSLELSRMVRGVLRKVSPTGSGTGEACGAGKTGPGFGNEIGREPLTPVSAGSFGRAGRRVLREYVYVPDAQIGWVPFAIRAGARSLQSRPGRKWIIYSSSVPYSAHLAAARLAGRFKLPWVAEFRDPWSAQDASLRPSSSFRRKLDRRLEGWILQEADRVVVTAARTRELIHEHFPGLVRGKVSVIPNGFEPGPEEEVPGPGEPMTLVHAGTLHNADYARPVAQAMVSLEEKSPGRIRLRVLGSPEPWRKAFEGAGSPEPPWLKLEGNVSPLRAREAIARASALLLPAPHPRFGLIVLGKLFSYLGARRPILGAVPPGCEMDKLIRTAGDGRLVPNWDEEGIRRELEILLREHRAGRLQAPRVPEEVVAPFTRSARTQELAQVFRSVLEEREG